MEQIVVFATLFLALVFFVWGKIRYDIVAFLALFALVVTNIIPSEKAFSGLGHPAVITVAAVLVISKAMQHSGLVDVIVDFISSLTSKLFLQVILLSFIVALASAFINNVGALAIILPVALHLSRKNGFSPSYLLMPIAFASILGGMMTLIGTPPNIIISTFRQTEELGGFTMFDFAPVGIGLTIVGLLFITIAGWRFLPKRQSEISTNNMFEIENYITEVLVNKKSNLIGKSVADIATEISSDIELLGIIRNNTRIHAPSKFEEIHENDILIIESDTDDLNKFMEAWEVALAEGEKMRKTAKGGDEVKSIETIVTPNSILVGKTISEMNLQSQYNVNILAIARQDKRFKKRISKVRIKPGDVLLIQGYNLQVEDLMHTLQCLPLAKRDLSLGKPRRIFGALSIFIVAIMLVVMGVLTVDIAFSLAAVLMVLSKILPIKEVYHSVDWPVIILLAAMIPVGEAFETSGGAQTVTQWLLQIGENQPTWMFIGLLMLITMLLSNVINNAATVVLMAPIAIQIAQTFSLSPDPFLMTVAVGASSAFLTPIGHQSNTLVMGPGGYKFKDYLIMGLPLTLLILLLGVPLILHFWPV